MIIQKINCPYGCERATFTESTETIVEANNNLLLESDKKETQKLKKVKIYTCNCCGRTFQVPLESTDNSQNLLFS